LFLFSAGSTAAAALTLLALWQPAARFVGARPGGGTQAASLDWLTGFDKAALTLELLALVIFLISLGSVARVFLSVWGAVLLLGVLLMGIVVPLAIGAGRLTRVRNRLVTSATLVLIGGFMLRVVVLLSSEQVRVAGSSVIRP
jgi:formate-dependent nitrite reductase membrane component NrfD